MGSQDGVSRANAIGMNYSNSYLDDKLEVQGSYFFNQLRTQLNDSTFDDYINTERASIAQQDRLSHNYSHRADMHITYRPNDKNQLIFRPSFNLQTTDADGFSTNTTWKLPLATVMDETFRRSDISLMQSSSDTRSISDNSSWNVGGSLVWRHRFDKQGRTLSMGLDAQVSGSSTDADYIKRYDYCMSKAALNIQSVILQRYLKPDGIRVLLFNPGWMHTPMGGPEAPIDPADSARGIADVSASLCGTLEDEPANGMFWNYDGTRQHQQVHSAQPASGW